jgi:hypothetical protein
VTHNVPGFPTDRFDDIARMERELGQSIAYLEEIVAAADKAVIQEENGP